MAAQGHVEDAFTFVGGLNTEGSFFLTPKNCWKEGDNIIPLTEGKVERRNAIKLEQGAVQATILDNAVTTVDGSVFTTHLWKSVNGNGNLDFVVIQVGKHLYFYNALAGAISGRKEAFVLDLTTYQAYGNTDILNTIPVQTANVNGELVVVSQSITPVSVKFDFVNDQIIVKTYELQIRDFDGLFTNYSPEEEKTEAEWNALGLKAAVIYNLYNQGWTQATLDKYKAAKGGKLPSNTKSWIYGKDSNDEFDVSVLDKQDFGSSLAVKGKFVLDAFKQERQVAILTSTGEVTSGIQSIFTSEFFSRFFGTLSGTITSSSSTVSVTYATEQAPYPGYQYQRPYTGEPVGSVSTKIYNNYNSYRTSAVGFFAGRVWYAGVPDGKESSFIFFSQVATDYTRYGRCYQQNDPTSEVLSDIQDDDGGVIVIPDAGQIVALKGSSDFILVFATNGVWKIEGTDSGFTAAGYIVSKLTNIGCLSNTSLIEVEDSWVYWSRNGIYSISRDGVEIKNASDVSIKSFYNNIPTLSKLSAVAAYDNVNKKIYWAYPATEDTNYKSKCLCYDVALNAWYTFTFADSNIYKIISVFVPTIAAQTEQTFDVVVGNDEVEVIGDQVVVNINTVEGAESFVKFVVLTSNGSTYTLSFADINNVDFLDWNTTDPGSYVITGYSMGNNGPARVKTAGYMSVFLERTETAIDVNGQSVNESSCLMQTRWDFTDNTNPGKWSTPTQVYRQLRPYFVSYPAAFDDGYPLVVTKNKIRGRGKALQIKLQSETNKDMKLVGWSMTFIGNTNV